MNVKDHYQNHLGNIYSWMAGDFNELLRMNSRFFSDNHIAPRANGIAFDLGCAHGPQSIALAKAGFTVHAVDFNRPLLAELEARVSNLKVQTVENDILHFLNDVSEKAELIVCMGDTLTHLESLADVASFIKSISDHLIPGGKVVVSFRDLTTELKAEDRFIAVRSDDSRILTCFLEYFPDYVMVHDLLYEKTGGEWIKSISSYPKLRLSPNMIADHFAINGIKVIKEEFNRGMVYMIGCV